jgi:hypothetical protein
MPISSLRELAANEALKAGAPPTTVVALLVFALLRTAAGALLSRARRR